MDRDLLIADLRQLLSHKHLGAFGMDALISILNNLIPELIENPYAIGDLPQLSNKPHPYPETAST